MKFCKRTRQSVMMGALGVGALTLSSGILTANAAERAYPTDLTNIAAASNGGRVLGVTSTMHDDSGYKFDANELIDGQVYNPTRNTGSPGWSSDKFDPVNMDMVTLGFKDNAVKSIGKLVFNPTTAVAPERWAKDIEVQVSTDTAEGPYRPVAQITLRKAAERQEFTILPVDARFVRLAFRTNQGSDRAVSLGEVEIYEAIPTSDGMGQLIGRLQSAITELKRYREVQAMGGNSGGTVVGEGTTPDGAAPAAFAQPNLSAPTLQLIGFMTVATPLTSPVATTNIALAKNGGKILDSSSTFDNDPAYGPENLIDGQIYHPTNQKNPGTNGWSSEGFHPGKDFVTIGFKDDRTRLIGKIVLNPSSNQGSLRWARRVDVQVTSGSAKDGPWRTVATINIRNEPVNQEFVMRPAEAKYVRFVFQANGPGDIVLPGADPNVNSDRAVSLGEIEIYEAKDDKGVLDSIIGNFSQILNDMIRLRGQKKTVSTDTPDGATATLAAVTDATPPDATTPDATTPDATTPDVKTPDAPATTPDTPTPDAAAPDTATPDTAVPDAPTDRVDKTL